MSSSSSAASLFGDDYEPDLEAVLFVVTCKLNRRLTELQPLPPDAPLVSRRIRERLRGELARLEVNLAGLPPPPPVDAQEPHRAGRMSPPPPPHEDRVSPPPPPQQQQEPRLSSLPPSSPPPRSSLPPPPPPPRHRVRRSRRNGEPGVLKPHVRARLDAALEHLDDAVVPAHDTVALLLEPPHGDHATLEDGALARLCRGYDSVPQDDWAALLADPFPNPGPSFADWCLDSRQIDAVHEHDERLLLRNKAITERAGMGLSASWIYTLLAQFEAIKFALDWAVSGPGVYDKKVAIRQALFLGTLPLAVRREYHAREPAAQAEWWKGPISGAYATWKRRHELAVTARNQLLRLYNLFGPAVFIDPVWSVYENRSRDFAVLLNVLADEPSVPARVAAHHESSMRALLALVDYFGSEDVVEYVTDFVEEYPPLYLRQPA